MEEFEKFQGATCEDPKKIIDEESK